MDQNPLLLILCTVLMSDFLADLAAPPSASVPPQTPSEGERQAAILAAFAVAHHDVWWAKGHAWTVSNWALAAVVALVGAGSLLHTGFPLPAPDLWLLAASTALILLANVYIGRMHADMIEARLKAEFLRGLDPALLHLRERLEKDLSDPNRGIVFIRTLILLTSTVAGIAAFLFSSSRLTALVCGGVSLLVGWFGVQTQARNRQTLVTARLYGAP